MREITVDRETESAARRAATRRSATTTAADHDLVRVGELEQLLVGLRLTRVLLAHPFPFENARTQLEQKRLAVAEKSHSVKSRPKKFTLISEICLYFIQKYPKDGLPVWTYSFRPWLRTIGAEDRIIRRLNDNYRGCVELALVHESHETTAVNVGRVDELQLEDLIACG